MKFKLHSKTFKAALFLSLVGLIALRTDIASSHLTSVPSDVIESFENSPRLNPIEEALLNPRKLAPLPPEKIDVETLWLARVIFSESKRIDEQALVAWVVRNRVETKYRGMRSYESVALDPHQFSAFRDESTKRSYYTGLTAQSSTPGWQTALRVAYDVRHADARYRPFSRETRHFYSERSLGEFDAPTWATGKKPVEIRYQSIDVDHWRFRFFEGVS